MHIGDLIGSAETAAVLGIDRSTLSRWISSGRIKPAMQLPGDSGAYLFHRADVEDVRASLGSPRSAERVS